MKGPIHKKQTAAANTQNLAPESGLKLQSLRGSGPRRRSQRCLWSESTCTKLQVRLKDGCPLLHSYFDTTGSYYGFIATKKTLLVFSFTKTSTPSLTRRTVIALIWSLSIQSTKDPYKRSHLHSSWAFISLLQALCWICGTPVRPSWAGVKLSSSMCEGERT